MKHMMLVGIEHIATGIQFGATKIDQEAFTLQFIVESASIFKVVSDCEFEAYHPVTGMQRSTPDNTELKGGMSTGHVDWWAGRMVPDMQRRYKEISGGGDYYGKQRDFEPAVVQSVVARQGRNAKDWFSMMNWEGILGCWGLTWNNMFLGIETDGYIHS